MTAQATKGQVRAIHALKSRIGLDDSDYRAALSHFGVASSKALSKDDAARFIDRLKGGRQSAIGNRQSTADCLLPTAVPARGALPLSGPYAKVCRALWLSAWNLGLLHDRTDKALTAFVERQTGIASLNWVRDPKEGAQAIEGLKAWIAREAGVEWPTPKQCKAAGVTLARGKKLAVIAAQKRILDCEEWLDPRDATDADLDEACQGFGRAIRAMKEAGR